MRRQAPLQQTTEEGKLQFVLALDGHDLDALLGLDGPAVVSENIRGWQFELYPNPTVSGEGFRRMPDGQSYYMEVGGLDWRSSADVATYFEQRGKVPILMEGSRDDIILGYVTMQVRRA